MDERWIAKVFVGIEQVLRAYKSRKTIQEPLTECTTNDHIVNEVPQKLTTSISRVATSTSTSKRPKLITCPVQTLP